VSIFSRITDWATTPYTIYLIVKDRAISWSAKLASVVGLLLIFAYMVSPLDIVPDFIPMSGWLDDLIMVPAGLALMRKFIPSINVVETRDRAQRNVRRIILWAVLSIAAVIILVLLGLGLLIYSIIRLVTG
jgi:uncharacterized membrane protein YkvA (DUF1232 family)